LLECTTRPGRKVKTRLGAKVKNKRATGRIQDLADALTLEKWKVKKEKP